MILSRSKLVADVHVFLIQEDNILLLRRYKTGFEDGKYSVIAGHHDSKETIRQTAVREASEEAGVTIEPEDLTLIHVMHYSTKPHRIGFFFRSTWPQRIAFFFVAETWKGQPENKEPNKCNELRWFSLWQLPQDMVSYVRSAIEFYQTHTAYSEFDWNQAR